ncbi:MAG TPA: PAS domain S-box protein [Thermoanaerobaculia bacterium]
MSGLLDSRESLAAGTVSLLDAIQACVAIIDAQGRVLHRNRAAMSVLHDGLDFWDAIGAVGEGHRFRETVARGEAPAGALRSSIVIAGGETRTIDWLFATDDAGRIVVTGADVTGEQQLWESEQHFRSIFDNSHDAILVLDPVTERVLEANARACELYGVTLDQLLGTSMLDFSTNPEELAPVVARLFERGVVEFDTTQRRADGTLLHLQVRASRIDYFGRDAILSVNRDVTAQLATLDALRDSERKYRSVVENVPDLLWIVDATGTVHMLSAKVEEVYGFTGEEIVARGPTFWFDQIHPDDVAAVNQNFIALFQEGKPYNAEYRFRRKDGDWIWLSDRAAGTYAVNGVLLADGITQDITGRKLAEEEQVAIADFGFSALTEHDIDALVAEACRTIKRLTNSEAVFMLRHVPEEQRFDIEAAVGDTEAFADLIIADEPGRVAREALDSHEPIVIDDIDSEPLLTAPGLKAAGFVSSVSMAVNGPYAPYGVLVIASSRRAAFSDRDVSTIRSIANFLGAAMARRAAEDETFRARRDYEALIEIAQEGVVVVNIDGTISFANAKAGELLGLTPPTLAGLSFLQLVSSEDRPELLRNAYMQLDGRATKYEVRLRRPDGAILNTTVAASPVYGDNTEVSGVLMLISDITDRVRAEQFLRRSETQLREAQALAHLGSFELDLDDSEEGLLWSDELYRIVGLEPQSQPLTRDFVFRTILPESIRVLLDRRETIDMRHELTRVDRARRFVRVQARIVTDFLTGRRRIVGTVQDITEERAAQQELLDREARLRLIVSHLPVILWSSDAELRITSMIGAGAEANLTAIDLDLSVEDLFGAVTSGADPAGALQGHPLTFETTRDDRDLRVHIEPLRDDRGDIVGTVGIAFDVTERNAAERAQRDLLDIVHRAAAEWSETFDSISSPIIILHHDRTIARLNRAALAHTDAAHFRDVIGQPVGSLSGSWLWGHIADAEGPFATRVVTEDGRQWDVVGSPWKSGERTTVVASDVTDIARMQEKLQRSERMSAVGALVAGVAHEVRNPLFGISATLDAFEAVYGEEQFRPYTSALREQLDRMNELMHDLLEFGRPMPTVLTAGAIGPVLVSARTSVRALAQQADVTITIDVPQELPNVRIDRHHILQVFENLLKNAIQHSPKGAQVEIHAARAAAENAIVVTVDDRGPGFREQDLGRIFEPFFTRRRGGTGLGLSLVQRIIDDHNGAISARNREGGGASITVTLPCAEETH